MNTTTASFPTGSEFRVYWSEYTYKERRVNGVMMNVSVSRNFKTDIFSTYEEAEAFRSGIDRSEKNVGASWVMVRLPGNKRFTMDFNAKKVN